MNNRTELVIEKIKKLLALSSSSNEHEAALAGTHVQRLLSEYNLSMADIDTSHKPDKANIIEIHLTKTIPKWQRNLIGGVSFAFDCKPVHFPKTAKTVFIGVGADAEIASYTFLYLIKVIRNICTVFMRDNIDAKITGRKREFLKQSYLLGVVSTITDRLRNQKIQTPITSTALIPVKDELINKAMNEIGKTRKIVNRKSSVNSEAFDKGQSDGENVVINKGLYSTVQIQLQIT